MPSSVLQVMVESVWRRSMMSRSKSPCRWKICMTESSISRCCPVRQTRLSMASHASSALHQRGHLDGLGPRAEDGHDLNFLHVVPPWARRAPTILRLRPLPVRGLRAVPAARPVLRLQAAAPALYPPRAFPVWRRSGGQPIVLTTKTAPIRIRAFSSPDDVSTHGREAEDRRQHIGDGDGLLLREAHVDQAVVDMAAVGVHGALARAPRGAAPRSRCRRSARRE